VKRLVLLRHAKAVPMEPELEDRDRVLAERGRLDAVRVGQFLEEEGAVPDLVLCSTAARTRQTLELMLTGWAPQPGVRLIPELYLARWLTIVNLIRQVRDEAGTLMVVSHNPGLEDCARQLARPPQDTKTRKLTELLKLDYPTAAVTILEFEIAAWGGIDRGLGELSAFVRPRDLRGPE
jgi:Phosphohistidine phosphatase SixA